MKRVNQKIFRINQLISQWINQLQRISNLLTKETPMIKTIIQDLELRVKNIKSDLLKNLIKEAIW